MTDATHRIYHGSPRDRGSADAFYGRRAVPHFYKGGVRIEQIDMTDEEVREYLNAYDLETCRKEWD